MFVQEGADQSGQQRPHSCSLGYRDLWQTANVSPTCHGVTCYSYLYTVRYTSYMLSDMLLLPIYSSLHKLHVIWHATLTYIQFVHKLHVIWHATLTYIQFVTQVTCYLTCYSYLYTVRYTSYMLSDMLLLPIYSSLHKLHIIWHATLTYIQFVTQVTCYLTCYSYLYTVRYTSYMLSDMLLLPIYSSLHKLHVIWHATLTYIQFVTQVTCYLTCYSYLYTVRYTSYMLSDMLLLPVYSSYTSYMLSDLLLLPIYSSLHKLHVIWHATLTYIQFVTQVTCYLTCYYYLYTVRYTSYILSDI